MDRDRTLELREIGKTEYDKRINEISANKEVTARNLEELAKKATDKRDQLKQLADEKKRLKAEKKFKNDPGTPIGE
jgi:predicted nuclease with TOPRIM domain